MNPTFIGIGAARSGTTWLHRVLAEHPQIHMSTPKQLDYFDKNILKHDLSWYLAHFDPAPDEHPKPVRGEISPRHASLPTPIIKQVQRRFPEARIVLMIRQPVDRIWSNVLQEFGFRRKRNVSALPLWKIQQYCQSPRSTRATDYEAIIDRWSDVFGRDHVHVELFDELKADPRGLIQRILAHIGADPLWRPPDDLLHRSIHSGAVIANQKADMPPVLRAELSRHWLDPTRRLNDRFGGRLSHWVERLERDAADRTFAGAATSAARAVFFSVPERVAYSFVQRRRWSKAIRRWSIMEPTPLSPSIGADPITAQLHDKDYALDVRR